MSFDIFEALFEFNKHIHHGVLCLEVLTKHDAFDREKIDTLAADVTKAKPAANAYLISVVGAAEEKSAAEFKSGSGVRELLQWTFGLKTWGDTSMEITSR